MNYLSFQDALNNFLVFSIKDILKQFPDFDNRRLVEWQHKGYITKLRRGYYTFNTKERGEAFIYFAANKLYTPSYISLESALSYYSLIPEGVFTTVSITSRNTTTFNTPVGSFKYRNVKPTLYFGYTLLDRQGHTIKMAEPEKSLLDYLYLHQINSLEVLEGIRLNVHRLAEMFDFDKFQYYAREFKSNVLQKRIHLLTKMINA